jgi:hypothetical protein
MNGVVSGVTGGVAGPLGGTPLSIARNSYSVVSGGYLAVSTENIEVVAFSQTNALITVGAVSSTSPFVMQSQRYSDDDLWTPRQRDKLPDHMKPRHVYDKGEIDAIVDKYRVNEKQRRLFHQYIDYLKSNGELSGDTLSRAELDDLAREFFRKYK